MPPWDYLEEQAARNRPQPYTVKEGDNWSGIAQQNGVDYNALLGYNSQVGNTLVPGTVVNIPQQQSSQPGYYWNDVVSAGWNAFVNSTGAPTPGYTSRSSRKGTFTPQQIISGVSPLESARQQRQYAARYVPQLAMTGNYGQIPQNVGAQQTTAPKMSYGQVPQNVGAPTVPLPGMTVQQSMINRMRSTPFLSRNDEVLVGNGIYTGSIAPGYNEWNGIRWANKQATSKSGGYGYSRRGGGGSWGGGWGGQSSRQWQGVGLVNWRM